MESVAGTGTTTPWERMFLECDRQGHVLWMNERARARLGPLESLLTALPPPHVTAASEMLQALAPGRHRTLASTFISANRRTPVMLVRLVALEHRVVFSAEVRARSTDAGPEPNEVQVAMLLWQSNATRNYFRLLKAHESLTRMTRPSRTTGAVVMEALETERTRIARELHSGAGQTLAGIKLNVELIMRRTPNLPETVQTGLDRIQALAEEALSEVRAISQRLHPPDWKRLDLAQAIEWLWVTTGIPEKFHATLDLHPLVHELPDIARFTIYRAAQEGLANILRHSGATELRLELGQRGDEIHLVLEDNGRGFDVQQLMYGASNPAMRGIGLRAMRDEILLLNGEFLLTSTESGTRMSITLPVSENR